MGQQKHQLVQMYNHQFTAAKEFYQELSSRRQCVLSSGWWWPCANYCPLQITLLSPASDDISALPRPGTSGRPTLAASWRHLGWCGLAVVVACAGYIWILGTESNSLSSSRSLRQPSIWYFLPSDPAELSWEKREGGEGKLSSRASGHSEIDGAQPSSSSKSWMDPNNCLKSAQFLF